VEKSIDDIIARNRPLMQYAWRGSSCLILDKEWDASHRSATADERDEGARVETASRAARARLAERRKG